MTMAPRLRKFALTVHIGTSVGLLGAIAAFLILAVTGLTCPNVELVRAAYLAMDLIARVVIVPLAFASLLTGIVQSLGTPWGLFRHYWVLAKLALTVFATAVLLLQMESVGYMAQTGVAGTLAVGDLGETRLSLAVHAGGGLLVLLLPVLLSVFKPRGRTRSGRKDVTAVLQ